MLRRSIALLLALGLCAAPALVACRRPGASVIQGKWRGTKADGVAPDAQKDANAFATQMELDVMGDIITVTYPKDQKEIGRYSVKSQDKTTLVITTDKDGPNSEETFTLVDAKTIQWSVVDGKTITFAKE